jgi:hypothetical protein
MKLTYPEDFAMAERLAGAQRQNRIGQGFDAHRFGPGNSIMLCGIAVPHDFGLVGHSDADVGLHALTDALLGAIGEADIGEHFPPTDPQWRGASSDRFVRHAVSLIHSLYGAFGSGMVDVNTGVLLQNRSAYFSLNPAHPNALAPGKIPMHTLIASMGFKNHKLWSVMGCMGADGQPQIQFQTYSAMMDHGLDIQQAVQSPRWLSGRFALGEARDTLHVESRLGDRTLAELSARGHVLNRWGAWNELAGHAHGITLDVQTGQLIGGADPRSDGAACGY